LATAEKAMPLSDDEQRRLDEIERDLRGDNPTFAPSVIPTRADQRPVMIATTALFLGTIVLVTGLAVSQGPTALGMATVVIGLSIMLRASARLITLRTLRHHT
jgi:hypothetical protein